MLFFRLSALRALALAAMIAIPCQAAADCYSGGTPEWGDVRIIQVDRCQMTNTEYPCYHAVFAGLAEHGNGLDGFMIAYRFDGRTGQYQVRTTGTEFDRMVQSARKADFFNLRLPEQRPPLGTLGMVTLDGPRDQILIRRCNVYTAIENGSDMHSEQYTRLIALIN